MDHLSRDSSRQSKPVHLVSIPIERSPTISASTSTSTRQHRKLNTPYGGSLVDLIVSPERAAEMKATAKDHRQPDAGRARALRPRAPRRRRLLAAHGLHGQGRLRPRRRRDAAGRRHALAACPSPCRSRRATASPRASRWPSATFTATCWPSSTSRRSTPSTRSDEAAARLRLARREAPRRRPSQPPARPLRRRPARGDSHPAPL